MSGLQVAVCVKRVPAASGVVAISADGMSVDARHVGYTLSPHEEAAVEAAVRLGESHEAQATVITLGPDEAIEQLREALAVGIPAALHLVAQGASYGPHDVAAAIAQVAREHAEGAGFDLLLFGTDAADTGDFQVGITVAYALGMPVISGVRTFEVADGVVTAITDGPLGEETYVVPLPAVLSIKEGGIAPRYPSIPGRLRAKKAPVEVREPAPAQHGTGRRGLSLPPASDNQVQILGNDKDPQAAAKALVDVLEQIGVVAK